MSLFKELVEIKTANSNIVLKAVYVDNSTINWKWAYFIYYYDLINHTFYINDLDNLCNNTRANAISIIDKIVNAAYSQEMSALVYIARKIQIRKKPKIIYIYEEAKTWFAVIEQVTLEAIKDKNQDIIYFKNQAKKLSLSDTLKEVWL